MSSKKDSQNKVFIMSTHRNVDEAINAIKHGVQNYSMTQSVSIESKMNSREMLSGSGSYSNFNLREKNQRESWKFENIVGKSREMNEIYDQIRKVAKTDATVLIQGESGTGKELVARAIHFHSPRKDCPFITLDCASIPESLLASELFGYEKGAFTGAHCRKIGKFEAAHRGTLFIDDVADINGNIQFSLLRFLQDKEFVRVGGVTTVKADVRVIAATNKDLYEEVRKQNFRQDLFYRLNVFQIYIPPLRERKEDIPLLAEHFMKIFARKMHKRIKGFTLTAAISLMSHDWPGNVRELQHLIERAVILTEGCWIDSKIFYPHLTAITDCSSPSGPGNELNLSHNLRCVERFLILKALERTNNNRTHAARILGITYRTLRYKMKKYGLD